MAEAAGLALGVVGVAGIFRVCMDILEGFDSYRDFSISSNQLYLRFDAEKLKLKTWAMAVGIDQRALKAIHHKRLDDEQHRRLVKDILITITGLFATADPLSNKLRILSTTSSKPDQSQKMDQHISPAGIRPKGPSRPSMRSKFGWLLIHESRFMKLVENLESLVDKLLHLIPPSTAALATEGVLAHVKEDPSLQIEKSILRQISARPKKSPDEAMEASLREKVKLFTKEVSPWHFRATKYETYLCSRSTEFPSWIYNNTKFQDWSSNSIPSSTTRVFWLSGPSGYGKTVLCAKIAEHLSNDDSHFVFCYFMPANALCENVAEDILRIWISELAKLDQANFDYMFQGFASRKDLKYAPNREIWGAFFNVVSQVRRCIFVVDGLEDLDQAGSTHALFVAKLFRYLQGTSSKILLTSRERPANFISAIVSTSKTLSMSGHHMSQSDTVSDIELYAKALATERFHKKDAATQKRIASMMSAQCSGSFLAMVFISNNLTNDMSKAAIQHTITSSPKELPDIYAAAWRKIHKQNDQDRTRALGILKWCLYSIRPMTVGELSEALHFSSEEDPAQHIAGLQVEPINEEYIKTEIENICAGLIDVSNSEVGIVPAQRIVQLTHNSVKDFLRSSAAQSIMASEFEVKHHLSLAIVCLQYLCTLRLQTVKDFVDPNSGDYWFYDYAIQHWSTHTNMSGIDDMTIQDLIARFLDTRNSVFCDWARTHGMKLLVDAEDTETIHAPSTPLLYAALLGSVSLMQKFHEKDRSLITTADIEIGTALQATCIHGHFAAFNMLMQWGASVDATGNKFGSTLGAAAYFGRRIYVERLLKYGAKVDVKNARGCTSIYLAARNGYTEIVKLLLPHTDKVDSRTLRGWTALIAAASEDHLEIVKLLLDYGAEVSSNTADGFSAVMLAAKNGNYEIAKLLLSRGADIGKFGNDGWNTLNLASYRGHLMIVRMLLDHGADAESNFKPGMSPLYLAAYNGHHEVVALLLAHVRHTNVATDDEYSPLLTACSNGHLEVIRQFLMQGVSPDASLYDQWTLLTMACHNGYLEVVQLLLDKHANINLSSSADWTPLNSAACEGHLDVVKHLLSRGADLEISNQEGWTPINSASFNGYMGIVQILLNYKANFSTPNAEHLTPLSSASYRGHLSIVKILIDRGADSTVGDEDGRTPLHQASTQGHSSVIVFLLEHGASTRILDNFGQTAVSLASMKGHQDAIRVLLEHGADPLIAGKTGWTPLNSASFNGHLECVRILLDHKASFATENEFHWTPLHSASKHDHLDIVRLLLAKGCPLEQRAKNGQTALHVACGAGHIEVVRYLLDHNADLSQTTNDGYGCLYLACLSGHCDVARLLLSRGIDIEAPSKSGYTPLNAASWKGHYDVVQLLLKHNAKTKTCSEEGVTPLSGAELNNHTSIVKLLQEHDKSILSRR